MGGKAAAERTAYQQYEGGDNLRAMDHLTDELVYVCTRVLAPLRLVLLYAFHPMQWADIIFLRAQLINFEHRRCKLKIND